MNDLISRIQNRESKITNLSFNIKHPSSKKALALETGLLYMSIRHEKCVHQELCDKGFESSLPLMTVTRQWSDRKKKVEVPLFRSYVFINIDISKEKFDALQTDGGVKFVTFCNKTVSIPTE